MTPNINQYQKTLNRMGWSMLLFIGLFYTCTVISEVCQPPRGAGLLYTAFGGIISAVCYMVPFFLAGVFFMILSRRSVTESPALTVRLPREFPLLIFSGLAILSAGAFINARFCEIIGYRIPDSMIVSENYDDPAIVVMYMTVALAPAFAEEFLFRGVFYTNLRPFGRAQAILISSLLFALMHQNIGQLFYTFLAGIAMALMYELTGSIWCSVFFHMINNEISVLSETLYYGSYGETAALILSVLDGVTFILGTASLVILILYYKKRAVNEGGLPDDFSGSSHSVGIRCDRPPSPREVCRSLLTPGMIAFTAVTCVLMGMTWLALALANLA